MKRILVLFFLVIPILISAQSYRHIGVGNGLSSRKVYHIEQDKKGYMWFLTHEGIDRYNGKEFKQYNPQYDGKELSSLQDLSWLLTDSEASIWVVGKKGKVFKYNPSHDQFILIYEIPRRNDLAPVTSGFIDKHDRIWLSCIDFIYIYDTKTEETSIIKKNTEEDVTAIIQYDSTHYYIGTEYSIYYTELQNNKLSIIAEKNPPHLSLQINNLYYEENSRQLFIGTFQKGVYILDTQTNEYTTPNTELTDISITSIKALNKNDLLIATDGAGIYKLNTQTHQIKPYIVSDFNTENNIVGNSINDIYIDREKRIWIANFPNGISIRDDRYQEYKWYKHFSGNSQSLVNDRVNAVIEDSEGDLWFATYNGISLYQTRTKQWKTFLSSSSTASKTENNVFLSLCEVSPGFILIGGFSSNIYQINKKESKVELLSLNEFKRDSLTRPDKYIRSILKDSQDNTWIGGYYNLKKVDLKKKEIRRYPGINSITIILEKDKNHLWVGTDKGLFLLNKNTGELKEIILQSESNHIYSLCQSKDQKLYIGTNGSGLLIYDIPTGNTQTYTKSESALLSNNIYTILSDGESNIIFSTDAGLTRYYPNTSKENSEGKGYVHNWTKEQGLKTNHFNQNSGILTKSGNVIFGSSDGAIEFNKNLQLPQHHHTSSLVFSEFKLFYESVYPNENNSPLKTDIDDTQELQLNYNQNIFSLKVSSINYDYPSNILYSWRLKGFYDSWTKPSRENIIRFTNLNSGKYTLEIRAVSNEDPETTLEERSLSILVKQPIWRTVWALLLYLLILGGIITVSLRLIYLRKQRKIADEKFQFFINTAHDIRTPLTLIKAPLEDIRDKEELTGDGQRNMTTAIRNIDTVLRQTTNLLNYERINIYSSNLYISELELDTFIGDIIRSFQSYADVKQISLTYDSNFRFTNVWFDREKMDSILKNIISNALKYTPEKGSVQIHALETNNSWSIEVKDTGIGIPAGEQKKVFSSHFRGSNAINSKITGSGLGMVLVSKMVKLHKGKISLSSVENKGTTIKITFPKGYKHFDKAFLSFPEEPNTPVSEKTTTPEPMETTSKPTTPPQKINSGQRILVADDSNELRNYLVQILSEEYSVVACENGKTALELAREIKPDLVISDVVMPEMRGDELCSILKNDIETSHIPVMLLTALNDEKNMLKGIQTGADEYIIKPFNIGILKATIANLLTNRARLRNKFASLEPQEEEEEVALLNCTTDLDWAFINKVKDIVDEKMSDPEFTLDVIAASMNMSRTSLYSKIKALTDLTPSDYVRHIRLSKAAQLLIEGRHNVTEVAEKTGFNDAKYFREVFKKHFHVSPSKYKG